MATVSPSWVAHNTFLELGHQNEEDIQTRPRASSCDLERRLPKPSLEQSEGGVNTEKTTSTSCPAWSSESNNSAQKNECSEDHAGAGARAAAVDADGHFTTPNATPAAAEPLLSHGSTSLPPHAEDAAHYVKTQHWMPLQPYTWTQHHQQMSPYGWYSLVPQPLPMQPQMMQPVQYQEQIYLEKVRAVDQWKDHSLAAGKKTKKTKKTKDNEASQPFDEYASGNIVDNWETLVFHRHGTYVFQAKVDVASEQDKIASVNAILAERSNLLKVSKDDRANHALQKLIEKAPVEALKAIAAALTPDMIMEMAKHNRALRVVQQLLRRACDIPGPARLHIKKTLIQEAPAHVTHQYVTKVVRIFIQSMGQEKDDNGQMELLQGLLPQLPTTMKDKYGCFLGDDLIEHGSAEVQQATFERLRPSLQDLAEHKYGSRVVEKVLDWLEKRSMDEELQQVVAELPSLEDLGDKKKLKQQLERLRAAS